MQGIYISQQSKYEGKLKCYNDDILQFFLKLKHLIYHNFLQKMQIIKRNIPLIIRVLLIQIRLNAQRAISQIHHPRITPSRPYSQYNRFRYKRIIYQLSNFRLFFIREIIANNIPTNHTQKSEMAL